MARVPAACGPGPGPPRRALAICPSLSLRQPPPASQTPSNPSAPRPRPRGWGCDPLSAPREGPSVPLHVPPRARPRPEPQGEGRPPHPHRRPQDVPSPTLPRTPSEVKWQRGLEGLVPRRLLRPNVLVTTVFSGLCRSFRLSQSGLTPFYSCGSGGSEGPRGFLGSPRK